MLDTLSEQRIAPEYWRDKRFFASPEVLQQNPRRERSAGWHSLEVLRKAGTGGVSYKNWQAEFPTDIQNASGTRHKHLRWDYERGRIGVVKDRGQSTPTPFADIPSDLENIKNDKTIPNATTRQALINARIGQGKFRAELMQRWDECCAVTGVSQSQLLRASHIKQWAVCSNEERLDPNNGLLLTANIDALFDQGLVAFESDGRMLRSELLSIQTLEYLGLPLGLRKPLTSSEKAFLAYHREEVFR